MFDLIILQQSEEVEQKFNNNLDWYDKAFAGFLEIYNKFYV